MFMRALITMLVADAVDRHMREQQHKAWLAECAARTANAAAASGLQTAALVYDPACPERPTWRGPVTAR